MTPADEIWNRACQGGGATPRAGDLALSALLLFHGLAMNGGVLHAVDCLSSAQLTDSQAGYRFFGFPSTAELLEKAHHGSTDEHDLDGIEAALDQEYWSHIPDDSTLVARFEAHYKLNLQDYCPLTRI